MKAIDLIEVLTRTYNAHPDADVEVFVVVDDVGDRIDVEQAVVMECNGTVDVLLCEQAIMDER